MRFVKYESGHWQLLVDNKPFFIKGMAYMPTKVGQSPDDGTLVDWMKEDDNHDGIIARLMKHGWINMVIINAMPMSRWWVILP